MMFVKNFFTKLGILPAACLEAQTAQDGRVDHRAGHAPAQDIHHRFDRCGTQAHDGFLGVEGDVGGEVDVLQGQKGVVQIRRLLLEHVQPCAGDSPILDIGLLNQLYHISTIAP